MKKARALAKAQDSIKSKQLVAQFGALSLECAHELIMYSRILQMMELLEKISTDDTRAIPRPYGMMVEQLRILGESFVENDHRVFENLAKIAKFFAREEVSDPLAYRVIEASLELQESGGKITSGNIAKLLDQRCPLPEGKVYDDAEIRRVIRAIGLRGTVEQV